MTIAFFNQRKKNPGVMPVSSDNYFSPSTTPRIPDRPPAREGANDNYFSRSQRQSDLLRCTLSGY
ncbi:MAG TPA: hypothetical protein VMG10_32910, partial [Gemmataceae bacterium]|nr:hypothetical protein [Gemmataceae bacterium]